MGRKRTNPKELEGKRFTRLVVNEYLYEKNYNYYYRCTCDCGNITIARKDNLKNGTTKSCGCLHQELLKKYKFGAVEIK